MVIQALFLLLAMLPAHAQEQSAPAALASRIADILLSNYDAKPVYGPAELLAKAAGRDSYQAMLVEWQRARTGLDAYVPTIHPVYAGVLDTVRHHRPDLYPRLADDIASLTILGFRNMELCHAAVTAAGYAASLAQLGPDDLDRAVRQPDFIVRQYELFTLEENIKHEIRDILAEPEFSVRLAFHRVVYDVLDRIRTRTIHRLRQSLALETAP